MKDNDKKRPKSPNERDGVIYTPGSAYNKQRKGTPPPVVTYAGVRKKPVRKVPQPTPVRQKSQYSMFFAVTISIGVIGCIVLFALMFQSFSGSKEVTAKNLAKPTNKAAEELPAAAAPARASDAMTAVVQNLSKYEQTLTVYDITHGNNVLLKTDGTSILKNKYGEAIVFDEISVGDLVDVEYDNSHIARLFLSRDAKEFKNVTNIVPDTINRKITIGNDVFSYTNQVVALSQGSVFDISSISNADVLSLKVYQNFVWCVTLEKGHGYIEFINKENLVDGTIEIDDESTTKINSTDTELTVNTDSGRLEVAEGRHRVTITAANYAPMYTEVTLPRDATEVIDLSSMQLNKGLLNLKVNRAGFTVKINGAEVDASRPIELYYGTYTVRVEKQGFLAWESTVTIDKKSNALNITLDEEVLMCKFSVSSTPDGAEIYIDNGFIGIAPCTANIEYGNHTLTYKKSGYKSINYDISLSTPTWSYELILLEENPFMPS
ncbi:hypothetical protein AGMMS49975_06790 [Clostridia bacterium]|nr:hypothetical protein AGMMS49975_06790 [Clostridia bacterium]GHU74240.1 hypothetical protein FACS1894188_01870 [Clostridia bacterium]